MAHLLNTPQELKELCCQLQETTDENTKKQLQQEISITEAKRDIASAKGVRSLWLGSDYSRLTL